MRLTFLDGCTISREGQRAFVVTLLLGFSGVLLVSLSPVFLKYFIDAITSGTSMHTPAAILGMMLATYALGSILYELKWVFFTRSDRHNYISHMAKLLGHHPDASAMRLHRAAQSNGRYLAILFLTVLPISVETLVVAGSVAFVANTALASCLLAACLAQFFLVVGRTRTLNPLFTRSREREFAYFDHLETLKDSVSLTPHINAWYDAVSSINQARYKLRAISMVPVIAAMVLANGLALYQWRDSVSIGALVALNTYFMQISAKIEMLGNSLREALSARNQMQMSQVGQPC